MPLARPFEPDPDFPGFPAADPSLPDMPWLEADVPPCPAAAPEEPEDCLCIDPLCPADMPPPACAPVPAFPPAPTCAPATPDIPYSKPAIKALCDICFKLHVLFIMPPSPSRLTSIGLNRMICPLSALFRSLSRITALRQRAFPWKEAGQECNFFWKRLRCLSKGWAAPREALICRVLWTRGEPTGIQGGRSFCKAFLKRS
jgi:hypothetical protein